jgi:hypothetical protein
MAIGVNFFVGAASAGLWGSYGLSKIEGAYAGSAIRVRESGGGTEADIGFSGSALDTAALATHCGANDGFITKWYDQSGRGHDLAQATAAAQPQLVKAGTYLGEALFDGVDDELTTAASSTGSVVGLTVHLAGRVRRPAVGAANAFSTLWAMVGGLSLSPVRILSAPDTYRANMARSAGNISFDEAHTPTRTVLSAVLDSAAGTLATQLLQYRNGTALSSTATTGTTQGAPAATTWVLGSSGGANYSRMAVQSFVIHEIVKTAGQVATEAAALLPAGHDTDGIDGFTSGLWACYGLDRLKSTATLAIRVRRSNDNAEQDVGFSGGLLDTAALLAFVGANDGFVTTWYDQSGNGNNAVQATAGNQPRIVASGVVDTYYGKTAVKFDGSNDHFATSASTAARASFTTFVIAKTLSSAAQQGLYSLSAQAFTNTGLVVYLSSTDNFSAANGSTGSVNFSFRQTGTWAAGQVLATRHNRADSSNNTKTEIFSGGQLQATTNVAENGTVSGNFAANTWQIGRTDTGAGYQYLNGYMRSLAIYEADMSDTDIENLSRRLG